MPHRQFIRLLVLSVAAPALVIQSCTRRSPPPAETGGDVPSVRASGITWSRAYELKGFSSGSVEAIRQTPEGGYILVGSIRGRGDPDGTLVMRLDPLGNPLWQKRISGGRYFSAGDVAVLPDGGYLVAGTAGWFGASGSEGWLLRLNYYGHILWQKAYGTTANESFDFISPFADGFLAGGARHSSDGTYRQRNWLMKVDGDGRVQWEHSFGLFDSSFDRSMALSSDGRVASVMWRLPKRHSLVLMTVDAGGKFNRFQKVAEGSPRPGFPVRLRFRDGAIIGSNSDEGNAREMKGKAIVARLDSGGKVLWAKSYGGSKEDKLWALTLTRDDGMAFAGTSASYGLGGTCTLGFDSFGPCTDGWIVRLDRAGRILWQKTYGFQSDPQYKDLGFREWLRIIEPTSDDGFVVAGVAPAAGYMWVMKTDSSGNLAGCTKDDKFGLDSSATTEDFPAKIEPAKLEKDRPVASKITETQAVATDVPVKVTTHCTGERAPVRGVR